LCKVKRLDWGTRKSSKSEMELLMKDGLYANIHRKRARIKAGSGEKMNKVGSKDAPTKQDFIESAKTAKPPKKTRKQMLTDKMKDM
jgi:hypothetical protein